MSGTKILYSAISIAAIAFIGRFLNDTYTIMGYRRLEVALKGVERCQPIYPDLLVACESFNLHESSAGRVLYIGCPESLETLTSRSSSDVYHGPIRGRIYTYNIDTRELVNLEMRDFPVSSDFIPRGFDISQLNTSTVGITIVNNKRAGGVIDIFMHNPGEPFIVYKETVQSELLTWPNDVYVVQEGFYVADDTLYGDWKRSIQHLLRVPLSKVLYYDYMKKEFSKVAGGFVSANGITGHENTVFVSDTLSRRVSVFEMVANGELKLIQNVQLDFLPHNLETKDLVVAGFPHFLKTLKDLRDSNLPSSSVVARIPTDQLGGQYFGGEYAAQPSVEEILFDTSGRVNGSTKAIIDPRSKQLFVTGFINHGVLQCAGID